MSGVKKSEIRGTRFEANSNPPALPELVWHSPKASPPAKQSQAAKAQPMVEGCGEVARSMRGRCKPIGAQTLMILRLSGKFRHV